MQKLILGFGLILLMLLAPVQSQAFLLYPKLVKSQDVFLVDMNEPMVSMLLRLTARLYDVSIQTTPEVTHYPKDSKIFIVRGESARRLVARCACTGYTGTDAEVYILDVPNTDMLQVLSHEAIHLLQISDWRTTGTRFPLIAREYQAEVLSRIAMTEFRNVINEPRLVIIEQYVDAWTKWKQTLDSFIQDIKIILGIQEMKK